MLTMLSFSMGTLIYKVRKEHTILQYKREKLGLSSLSDQLCVVLTMTSVGS